MKYYPICLDLHERPCVIVGGGQVAERKTLSLLDAGAVVTIVSPSLTPPLQNLSASGKIKHLKKTFHENDLAGACLVIAATNSPEVNAAIGKLCRKNQVLVNVVAPPEESSFIVPSVVERGELLIAISTSGVSPALSRRIRQELERQFGPEYGLFLQKMAAVRNRLMSEVADEETRREVLQKLAESDVLDLLRQGKTSEADQRIAEVSGLRLK